MGRPSRYLVPLGLAFLVGCRVENAEIQRGLNAINAADLAHKIQVLAADSMEGRAPSSPGEEKTVRYLVEQFRQLGLRSGSGEDYLQPVPLVSIAADRDMTLAVQGKGALTNLGYGDQFIAFTSRVVERTGIQNSELVFAGYGIVAPEYGWNDFADTDVKGKTILVLVNDPQVPDPSDPSKLDDKVFNGRAMTYYGRWTYKYEEAARQGLEAPGRFSGTGVRWLPVEHVGNRNESPEEATAVATLYHDLLAGRWWDRDGVAHSLGSSEILVVAPYNAQVERLNRLLPMARVGTVDKFQGQEAAVVIYSMATSSPEEMPRSLEFLYSLNRLNVATSRARCLAIVVASPRLLAVQAHTPQQMRLANALCRLVEVAGEQDQPVSQTSSSGVTWSGSSVSAAELMQ